MNHGHTGYWCLFMLSQLLQTPILSWIHDPHKTADLQNSASPSIRICKRSVMLSCKELLQPGLIISLRDV
jgi:hypothetical protein